MCEYIYRVTFHPSNAGLVCLESDGEMNQLQGPCGPDDGALGSVRTTGALADGVRQVRCRYDAFIVQQLQTYTESDKSAPESSCVIL